MRSVWKVALLLGVASQLVAAEEPDVLPPIDDSHIPEMSDEEQAEIEAILDARTDEDNEIAFTQIVEIDL